MSLGSTARDRLRVVIIVLVTLGALSVFLWWRTKQTGIRTLSSIAAQPTPQISPSLAALTPTPIPEVAAPTPTAAAPQSEPGLSVPSATDNNAAKNSFIGTLKLIIPVAGVRPEQLLDTFSDARSEGRVHDAIDIPAPAGTPVVAASDGEIVKLFQSERGGTTIYQLSPDKKLVFYYAHLQRYADGLDVGKFVHQGEVIAYVGDTGNAGAGNYHLHFSIAVLADPKRYWDGTNLNPYPLLR